MGANEAREDSGTGEGCRSDAATERVRPITTTHPTQPDAGPIPEAAAPESPTTPSYMYRAESPATLTQHVETPRSVASMRLLRRVTVIALGIAPWPLVYYAYDAAGFGGVDISNGHGVLFLGLLALGIFGAPHVLKSLRGLGTDMSAAGFLGIAMTTVLIMFLIAAWLMAAEQIQFGQWTWW